MRTRIHLAVPLAGALLGATGFAALAAGVSVPAIGTSASFVELAQHHPGGGRGGGGGGGGGGSSAGSGGHSGGGSMHRGGGGGGGGGSIGRGGGGGGGSVGRGHSGRSWSGGGGGGRHYYRRHRHRDRDGGFGFYFGPSYGYYDGYYGSDCEWLRRRAIRSGSRYWWRRYRNCID